MRQGVPTIINPYDLFSLEEALRLRDKFGGEVTVLTMGPPMAADSLRKALTIGADRAVLLTDRFFAGSDTLATSYRPRPGDPQDRRDFWRAGHRLRRQADHRRRHRPGRPRHRQAPRPAAAHLCLRHYRNSISQDAFDHRRAPLGRRRAGAARPGCPASSPCSKAPMSCGAAGSTTPCAPRAPKIVTWSAKDAGIEDVTQCGLRGSPTVVKRVFAPPPRAEKASADRPCRQQDAEGHGRGD